MTAPFSVVMLAEEHSLYTQHTITDRISFQDDDDHSDMIVF